MEKSIAWIWSICLSLSIARALTGGAPNWIDVFCPLVIVVINSWAKVYLKGK